MTYEEINDLVSKYADELYEGYDMADFQTQENRNDVEVICAAFLGHILETHDILPKSPESATMVGWVARDKDNRLRLHNTMPQKASGWYWQGGFKSSYLPDNLFPSVTWESEPLKVKLTITPTEDE